MNSGAEIKDVGIIKCLVIYLYIRIIRVTVTQSIVGSLPGFDLGLRCESKILLCLGHVPVFDQMMVAAHLQGGNMWLIQVQSPSLAHP
jgi:hypothetical protein